MQRITLAKFMNQRHLELILLPTEKCNFRCTYCYEDFELGQMKGTTIEAIKKLIIARLDGLDVLSISWFGGEPLMAKSVMQEICEFAKAACEERRVIFSSSITTNAYGLDFATFENLIKLGITDYQISLDGDEPEHNNTRKLVSGRGTFEKIWCNLLESKNHQGNFDILLRIHVHKDNLASIRRLLLMIVGNFGNDLRYNIFLKPVGNWGGDSVKSLNLVHKSDGVLAELQTILDADGWNAKRVTDDKSPDKITPCYAAKPNSFVIRADGSLAKCTVAFNDVRNSIGRINDDGTLTIENEKMRTFMRGFQSLNKDELTCPMKGMRNVDEVKFVSFDRHDRAGVNKIERN
jgi:uncharacterized protein